MKKVIKQFSKYAVRIVLLGLVISFNSTVETYAQTKLKSATTPKVYWYLDFTVTIKGSGKQTNEDGDKITDWIVDRSYSGFIKLNDSMSWYKPGLSKQENKEAIESHRFTAYHNRPADLDKVSWMPITVRISDRYRITIKDDGEGSSFEYTKALKTWKFNHDMNGKMAFVPNAVQLSTDSKLRTYNVFIPILATEGNKEYVSLFLDTVIDRSSYGYGDAPTHEEKPVQLVLVSIHSLGIPNVKGLIEDGAIQHIPNDFLFPVNVTTAWEYDSFKDFPDLQPDAPIFPDVPDSKSNVKIRVIYRFSKTPFY